MESFIVYNEGNKPNPNGDKCFFCEEKTFLLFNMTDTSYSEPIIINGNETSQYASNGIYLCNKHAEAINSLLSGEHDINQLITVMRSVKQKKLNLRR